MSSRTVTPGSPAAQLIEEEERLLARVQARVATAGIDDGKGGHDYERDLLDLRDQVAEAKPEDLGPLVEQMMRAQAIAARRGRSRALPVDPMAPYFAHLRVKLDGQGERDILVGKRGFIDRAGGVQIVDWRNAPISQIYYRYEEGDDFDETFEGGRLTGEVLARRNVSIMGGKLRRIGTPEGTFVRDARGTWHHAEGELRPVLHGGQGTAARPPRPQPTVRGTSRQDRRLGIHHGSVPRGSRHLPEIAALIDKEQFDLISRPDSGLVVIQGGAGSGKTTVALHRVALLHFRNQQRFRPGKMLVVVPSHALARYVEGVLPSLGVPGVPVVTYKSWAQSMRRRLVPQAGTRTSEDTPELVARLKKHPALLRRLETFCDEQMAAFQAELPAEVLPRWNELVREPLVVRLRRTLSWVKSPRAESIPARERHLAEGILRRLRKRAADVVLDWEELLTDRGRLALAFAGTDVTPEQVDKLVRWVVGQKETPATEEYQGVDEERLTPVDGRALDDMPDTAHAGSLDLEDEALLLRLYQRKHGGLVQRKDGEDRETRYEHLVIDEAQDLAPVDVKVLLEATTDPRSVTIAGDTAQRLVFDNAFRDWATLLGEAGTRDAVQVSPLRLSYRSTAEVMRFARDILGPLQDPDQPLVARPGEPVALEQFADMGEAIAFLGDALRSLSGREPTASVALISRHPEQADAYHAALQRAEVPALRRVRREDFTFAPGVDVTDVTQVKGLEFDYVILVEVTAANYPDTVEARHLLHIAATRAAHQLWLVTTAEPSPLLPADMVEPELSSAEA